MRRLHGLVIGLLVSTAGLAGCLGGTSGTPSGEPTPRDAAGQPLVEHLEAGGCREQIGIFPMEATEVAPYLPDGFVPLPFLPPEVYQDEDPTGKSATLLLVGFACEQPPGTSIFLPLIPVDPPEEHRERGVYYHAVALPCIADAATAERLATWQVPCQPGASMIEAQRELPTGALWSLTAESPTTTIEMDGNAPASRTPAGPEWVRLFHATDGDLCAISDSRVELHEHWQFGGATVTVEGEAEFPVPDRPGMASLGMPGFALNLTVVPDAGAGGLAASTSCV